MYSMQISDLSKLFKSSKDGKYELHAIVYVKKT